MIINISFKFYYNFNQFHQTGGAVNAQIASQDNSTGNSTDNSTTPWDFAALCKTGQCPTGWNTEEESCSLNMEDLEETAAKERCAKYRGVLVTASQGRYQCKGEPNLR